MLSLFCKIFVFLNLAFYGTLFLPTKLFSQSSDTSSSSTIATVDFSDLLTIRQGANLTSLEKYLKDLQDNSTSLNNIQSNNKLNDYQKQQEKVKLNEQKKNLLGNIETSINSIGGFKDNKGTVDKLLKRYSEGLSRQSSLSSLSRQSTTSSKASSIVESVTNPEDLLKDKSVPKPTEEQSGEPQTIPIKQSKPEPVVDRSLSQAMDAQLAKQRSEIDEKLELARQKSRDRQVKKTEQNKAIESAEMAVQTKAPPPSDQQDETERSKSPKTRPSSAKLMAKESPTPNSVVAEESEDNFPVEQNTKSKELQKEPSVLSKPAQNNEKSKDYPVVAPEFVASFLEAQTIRELEQKNQALELEKKKAEKLAQKAKAQAEKAAQEQKEKEETERVKAQEEQAKKTQEETQRSKELERLQQLERENQELKEKAAQEQQKKEEAERKAKEKQARQKKEQEEAEKLRAQVEKEAADKKAAEEQKEKEKAGSTTGAIRARIKKASSVQRIETDVIVQGPDEEDNNGVPKLPSEKVAAVRISREQKSVLSERPAELEEEIVRVADQESKDLSAKPGSVRPTLDSRRIVQPRPSSTKATPAEALDDSAKKRAPLASSEPVEELLLEPQDADVSGSDPVLAEKKDVVKSEQNDQAQEAKKKEYPVVAPEFIASSAAAQRIQELEKESQQKSAALALEKKKSDRAAAKLKNKESAAANESPVASVDPNADGQVNQVAVETVSEQASPPDRNGDSVAAGDGASAQAGTDRPTAAQTVPVPVVGADAAAPKVEADKKSSKIIAAVANAMDKLKSKLKETKDKMVEVRGKFVDVVNSAKEKFSPEKMAETNTSSRVEIADLVPVVADDTKTVSLPQKSPAADEPKREAETDKLAQESPKEQAVGIEKEVEGAKVQAEEAQKIREEEKRKQQELVDLAVENKKAANLKKAQAKKDVEDEKLVPLSVSSKNSFTSLSEKAGRVEKSLAEKKANLSISFEELKTSKDAGVRDILSAEKKRRATGGASLAAKFIKNAAAGAALGDEGRDERKKARTADFDKLKSKK